MVSRFLLNSFCSFGFTPRDGTKGQCSGAESILSPLTRAPAGVDGACAAGWGGRAGAVWMAEVKHRDPEISGLSNRVLGCCGYWRNDGEHRRVTEKAGSTAG